MRRSLKSKSSKIFLGTLALVLVFIYLIFSKGNYKEYNGQESFGTLMSVLLNTVKSGGEIELTQKDINILGSSYFKDGVNKGSLIIKGLNVDISKDKAKILIPVKFKGLTVLLTTEGKISIQEKDIVYTPGYFKLGKIILPKGKVLDYIGKHFKGKLTVDNYNIVLNKNVLPEDIESFTLDEGRVLFTAKKEAQEMLAKTNESIKKIEQKVKEEDEKSLGNSSISDKNAEREDSKSGDNSWGTRTDGSLSQVQGELSALHGSVSTAKEKQMVSIMSSTVSKLQSNPSYNFWGNAKNVISIYKTLTPKQKEQFKSKFYANIDMGNALKLKDDYE